MCQGTRGTEVWSRNLGQNIVSYSTFDDCGIVVLIKEMVICTRICIYLDQRNMKLVLIPCRESYIMHQKYAVVHGVYLKCCTDFVYDKLHKCLYEN